MDFLLGLSWAIVAALNFTKSILLGSLNVFYSLCWTIKGCFGTIKPSLKFIKNYKRNIAFLENQLEEETNNLKELQKKQKNNIQYMNEFSKEITTSEKIKNLKHKLEIIDDYNVKRKIYMEFFNIGKLELFLSSKYSTDDIKFIEELIKNDINNKKSAKQNSGFTKKLKK